MTFSLKKQQIYIKLLCEIEKNGIIEEYEHSKI